MIDRLAPHISNSLLTLQENSSGVIESIVTIFKNGSFNIDQNSSKTNRQIFTDDVSKVLSLIEILVSYGYLTDEELNKSKDEYLEELFKTSNFKFFVKGQQLEFDF